VGKREVRTEPEEFSLAEFYCGGIVASLDTEETVTARPLSLFPSSATKPRLDVHRNCPDHSRKSDTLALVFGVEVDRMQVVELMSVFEVES